MKYTNILVGADIECFLQHKETKEIVSAEGFIKGTKHHPFCFDATNKHFATSLDNVLAEFCIPPAKTKMEFYNNIFKSVGYINKTIPKEYCIAALPSANLDEKYLQTPQALLFGCEPDYNAYTRNTNIRPMCKDHTLRSAGGHIHIGYQDSSPVNRHKYEPNTEHCAIIQACDLFLGIPSVIMEPDNKRKELYGKAGAFRPKPYGVEYRTISNFYLQSKQLILWVYEAIQQAIAWLNAGNTVDNTLAICMQGAIDNNNKHTAEDIIKHFNLKLI